MIAVNGTYQNGKIYLEQIVKTKKPIKVIVTFLDDEIHTGKGKRLTLKDFSFIRSREKLQGIKVSLADAVIEERRDEL